MIWYFMHYVPTHYYLHGEDEKFMLRDSLLGLKIENDGDNEKNSHFICTEYEKSYCRQIVEEFVDESTCFCVVPSSGNKIPSPKIEELGKKLFNLGVVAPFKLNNSILAAKQCSTRDQRLGRNNIILSNVFVDFKQLVSYKKVILFDDVTTTGTSIDSYAVLLESQGMEVLKVAVGYTYYQTDKYQYCDHIFLTLALLAFDLDFSCYQQWFNLELKITSFRTHFGDRIKLEDYRNQNNKTKKYILQYEEEFKNFHTFKHYYYPKFLLDKDIHYFFAKGNRFTLYGRFINYNSNQSVDDLKNIDEIASNLNPNYDVFILKEKGYFALDILEILEKYNIKVIYVKDSELSITNSNWEKEVEKNIIKNNGLVMSVKFPENFSTKIITEQLQEALK